MSEFKKVCRLKLFVVSSESSFSEFMMLASQIVTSRAEMYKDCFKSFNVFEEPEKELYSAVLILNDEKVLNDVEIDIVTDESLADVDMYIETL